MPAGAASISPSKTRDGTSLENRRTERRGRVYTKDSFCKDSGVAATNDQTGILYQEFAFDPTPIMKTPVDLFRRGYELLVSGANVLQSPFLLLLRIYFFWQLFQTGQGKLAHIEKISDYFASLGIPLPTLNAYMAGATETFGSLLLIIGLASRLTAIPITVVMAVAYLTADLEAVTGIFSDPDKFVKADPFPFLISALIVLVFGPGKFSIDALIKWLDASRRNLPKRSLRFGAPVTPTEAKAQH
jgi:putative oxidoreductase